MYISRFADAPSSQPAQPQPPVEEQLLEEEEKEDVGKEISAVLSTMLPWGISVLLHVGILILAIFIVWTTVKQVQEEAPIVPSVRLSERPGAQLSQSQQKVQQQSAAKRSLTKSTENSQVTNQKVKLDSRLIGVAGGSAGAKANPFGGNVGADGPFAVGFIGGGGNARKIAFIIDASGSLIDTLPFVIQELKKTINDLSDQQSFAVIFAVDGHVVEMPPSGLTPATPEMKEKAMAWMDPRAGNVVPRGLTDPVPAVIQALRYRPDLLYILSDNITGRGHYERDQKELLAEIERANSAGTKINTLQFLYKDPLEAYGFQPTLKVISDKSGGVYKLVDAGELGLR